jgi:hypothetical protein
MKAVLKLKKSSKKISTALSEQLGGKLKTNHRKLTNIMGDRLLDLIEETLVSLIIATPVDKGVARLNWRVYLAGDTREAADWTPEQESRKTKAGRESQTFGIGEQSAGSRAHIASEMMSITPKVRNSLKDNKSVKIIFRNEILYYDFLEQPPLGKKHPRQIGDSWAGGENGFMKHILLNQIRIVNTEKKKELKSQIMLDYTQALKKQGS